MSSLLPPGSCLQFVSRIWVQRSHCSSTFHRMLLTHALALSASQFEHKKKSQRIYMSMHSAGLELTKLAYTRLEDNLIPGTPQGRPAYSVPGVCLSPRNRQYIAVITWHGKYIEVAQNRGRILQQRGSNFRVKWFLNDGSP